MSINNLNKVLNLVLTGSLIILLFIVIEIDRLSEIILQIDKNYIPLITGVSVVFLIPVAFLWGVVLEAITEFFRGNFEKIIGDTWRIKIDKFFCNYTYHNYAILQDYSIKKLNYIYFEKEGLEDVNQRSLLVGFFFRTANSESIDWVIQHYSSYRLCLNYIVLLPFIFYTFFNFGIWIFSNLALIIVSAIHLPSPLQGAVVGRSHPGLKPLYTIAALRHSLAEN